MAHIAGRSTLSTARWTYLFRMFHSLRQWPRTLIKVPHVEHFSEVNIVARNQALALLQLSRSSIDTTVPSHHGNNPVSRLAQTFHSIIRRDSRVRNLNLFSCTITSIVMIALDRHLFDAYPVCLYRTGMERIGSTR